jgi:hypothetical protein
MQIRILTITSVVLDGVLQLPFLVTILSVFTPFKYMHHQQSVVVISCLVLIVALPTIVRLTLSVIILRKAYVMRKILHPVVVGTSVMS